MTSKISLSQNRDNQNSDESRLVAGPWMSAKVSQILKLYYDPKLLYIATITQFNKYYTM